MKLRNFVETAYFYITMHCVESKFRRSINWMISPGDRILAAVSGGADSLVMLHLLNKLRLESSEFSLAVAHLNHLARGKDSKRDADFVVQLGKNLNIETYVEDIDVTTLSFNSKTSFQETARNVRYDFLNRTLRTWSGNKITLGHNADDHVETFLMNMLRGSGLLGLTGIPQQRGHFIRPLHDCFRSEINNYAELNKINYCLDVTNQKTNYLRNRIRLDLIPILELYNPQIKHSLKETSRLLTDDENYMQDQVNKIMEQAISNNKRLDYFEYKINDFQSQHPALQKRLIRQAIFHVKGDLRAISASHVLSIFRLINYPTGRKEIHLPGSIIAICDSDKLSIQKTHGSTISLPRSTYNDFLPIDINVPGLTDIGVRGLKFSAKVISPDDSTDRFTKPNIAYLDYEKTGPQIKLRFFQPGDRFVPLGMLGNKKLKSFFIDEKIPRCERGSIPILISKDGDIIWVYSKRIGENYRITDKTRRVLLLEGVSI